MFFGLRTKNNLKSSKTLNQKYIRKKILINYLQKRKKKEKNKKYSHNYCVISYILLKIIYITLVFFINGITFLNIK